jgi:type II secretory pathway component PulF
MQAARQGGDMASAMLEAQAKRDATKKLREEGKKPIGLPQKRGA